MPSGPPKILEDLAKILIPPACHEAVLGDLYERYKTPAQYLADLILTVPFVILSRLLRTTQIRLLLMDALLIYGSFLAVAWHLSRKLVTSETGLLQLAVPAGLTLVAALVDNAYLARPGKPTFSGLTQSLVIAAAALTLCWAAGLLTEVNLYGYWMGQMMVSTARLMFDSDMRQPQGVGGPPVPANKGLPTVTRAARITMTLIWLGIVCLLWWMILGSKGAH